MLCDRIIWDWFLKESKLTKLSCIGTNMCMHCGTAHQYVIAWTPQSLTDDHTLYSVCTLKLAMQVILLTGMAESGNHASINVRRFNGLSCSFLNEIPHMLMMVYVNLGSAEVMEHLHVLTHHIDFENMASWAIFPDRIKRSQPLGSLWP